MKKNLHLVISNSKKYSLHKISHFAISNPIYILFAVILAIIFSFGILIFYKIAPINIEHAILQYKRDNKELILTHATIVNEKDITSRIISNSKQVPSQRITIYKCVYTYVYSVNGRNYIGSESYLVKDDSNACYHGNNTIEVYYDPNDVKNSISADIEN